ncbi:hypothetical protein J2S74_005442 [Evansella vedderi]|uniref:Uncharacterized protein n=1 Tax=Evansella vedderi TaxID=38282 RepID=A0ABU0A4E5_9BACI|nr:hypothetical protein [Evansella vedderi]
MNPVFVAAGKNIRNAVEDKKYHDLLCLPPGLVKHHRPGSQALFLKGVDHP